MAVVFIPALLRNLTAGAESLYLPGNTVGEVIQQLEVLHPGVMARLVDGDRLRPGITVVVDGEVSRLRLRHTLNENSEVHFLPAISGG
jgi:molybdopterin converting factor small subunit